MVRILSTLSAALLATLAVSAAPPPGWLSNTPDNGLYISHPDKDTVWQAGQQVHFRWTLDKTDSHNRDQFKIVLTNKYRTYAVSDVAYAQNGFAQGQCYVSDESKVCGVLIWGVPRDVVPGRYQAVMIDNNDGNLYKETRFFNVVA
ncbi:uncharacterized protein SRS1_14083 [Sporisorium reilianum f. sp. reilianum]|uniref:Uncharacterized protein n=1 Tax=Sporisorium reilianum f. sp. reilianum TaxID=72559 RepID=A0A2N8UEV6_9BASI|nr:uncharacterized protein SRS1_14083 [Sporisorium reilianum f. sp. reilianum]